MGNDTTRSITVHSARLVEAINLVKHAAGTNLNRPILCSILIDGNEAGTRLVAADNYRIAIADLSEEASEFGQAVIPIHNIPLLVSICRGWRQTIVLTREEGPRLTVEAGPLSLGLRLVDGTYPNYESADLRWDAGEREAIGVRPSFIGDVTRALSKHLSHVRIYPGETVESPILVTSPGFREVIMPVRLSMASEKAA